MDSLAGGNVVALKVVSPRQPPYSVEAEQALLGALLINNASHARVADFLAPHHFGYAVHRRIFEAIGKAIDRGETVNPVILGAIFIEDRDYLFKLAAGAITIVNVEDYGRLIHDLYLRRQLIEIGENMVNEAYKQDIDDPAPLLIERAERQLYETAELSKSSDDRARWAPIGVAVDRAIATIEKVYQANGKMIGLSTGLRDLDSRLGGLQASDLIIIAGRPSMGKSALAFGIGSAVARTGRAVLGFSLEMSAEQIAMREIAKATDISTDLQRAGPLTSKQMDDVTAARDHIAALPMVIDDGMSTTVAQIRSRARRFKRQHGLSLIIIDYLQLLVSEERNHNANRVQEVSAITRGLKGLAKELQVPVIAVSQLSRAVEAREDKRPNLADLRESGSIEQDADVVMFVYREEYYHARNGSPTERQGENPEHYDKRRADYQAHLDKVRGIAEILIPKQRMGRIGAVRVHFNGNRTAFENLARPYG